MFVLTRSEPTGRLRHRFSGAVLTALTMASVCTACGGLAQSEDTPASTETPRPTQATKAPHDDALFLQADADGDPGKQLGTAKVLVDISTLDGGVLRTVKSQTGSPAYEFPPFVPSGKYPRAAVIVTNAGATDAFNPGRQPFSWGASFKLDTPSEGRPSDNGDNLIQRGLYSEPTFYKAELDEGKAACEVRGTNGVAVVRSRKVATPGQWFRMRCERVGEYLTVRVYKGDQASLFSSEVKLGRIGPVEMRNPRLPVSIGGKVAPNGALVGKATDQFNGVVADPFVHIGT